MLKHLKILIVLHYIECQVVIKKNIATHPWTKTVEYVRDKAIETINQKLNHCVLTLFRNENDSLHFHQDKLLDLKENSLILSISFGAIRPILFYSLHNDIKKQHRQYILLQPGSLLAIGPNTNLHYKHAIPKLKEECLPRISMSFRYIDTFIKNETIIGKGEEYQCKNYPFITSYDNEPNYNLEIINKINQFKQKAQQEIEEIKKTFCYDKKINKINNIHSNDNIINNQDEDAKEDDEIDDVAQFSKEQFLSYRFV